MDTFSLNFSFWLMCYPFHRNAFERTWMSRLGWRFQLKMEKFWKVKKFIMMLHMMRVHLCFHMALLLIKFLDILEFRRRYAGKWPVIFKVVFLSHWVFLNQDIAVFRCDLYFKISEMTDIHCILKHYKMFDITSNFCYMCLFKS